jgi:four helix bundle protein
MGNYFDLKVWQQAKDLAVRIILLPSDNPPLKKEYSLMDQIKRSAVSIASNIAEGNAMPTTKHSLHFFYLAKGSLAELSTQFIIARDARLISENDFHGTGQSIRSVGILLSKLIQSLSNTQHP